MNHYKTQPPWEFLLSASRNSLQSYELSRLSHAANLRKEIGQLLDSWLEENAAAMLARWLMEHRERPASPDEETASSTEPRSPESRGVEPRSLESRAFESRGPESRGLGSHAFESHGLESRAKNGRAVSDNIFSEGATSPGATRTRW